MICIFMILSKVLVSKDAASCVPGVKCFFVRYCQVLNHLQFLSPLKQILLTSPDFLHLFPTYFFSREEIDKVDNKMRLIGNFCDLVDKNS